MLGELLKLVDDPSIEAPHGKPGPATQATFLTFVTAALRLSAETYLGSDHTSLRLLFSFIYGSSRLPRRYSRDYSASLAH